MTLNQRRKPQNRIFRNFWRVRSPKEAKIFCLIQALLRMSRNKNIRTFLNGVPQKIFTQHRSSAIKSTKSSAVLNEDDPLNLDKTRDLAKQALEALASVAGQVEDDVDVTQAFSKFKVTRINNFCIVLMSDFVERLHEQMYSICDSKMVTPPKSKRTG